MKSNMISLLLISLLLSLSDGEMSNDSIETKWKVSIMQDSAATKNEVKLSYGMYSGIEIIFEHDQTDSTLVKHIEGTLLLDSVLLQIPQEQAGIPFNTATSLSVKAHIGKGFPNEVPPSHGSRLTEETVQFKFTITSTQSDMITSDQFTAIITKLTNPYQLKVILSDKPIGIGETSSFTIETGDSFFNVNPITITFKRHENTSSKLSMDDYKIPSYPNKPTTPFTYGLSSMDWIVYPQVFIPEVVYFAEYFTIDSQVEFSINEETINTLHKQAKESFNLITVTGMNSNDVSIENIAIPMFPIVLSCAIHDITLSITDDDIRSKTQGSHAVNQLQFHQEKLQENQPSNQSIKIDYKDLSRFSVFKVKCLVEVDKEVILQPKNFKGFSYTIGYVSDADMKIIIPIGNNEFTESNCCTWQFTSSIDKATFLSKTLEYLKSLSPEHAALSNDITDGCFHYDQRNTSTDKTASICLVPLTTCKSLHLYDYYHLFLDIIKTLSTKDLLSKNLLLDTKLFPLDKVITESDYFPYNTDTIKIDSTEKTDQSITIAIKTEGLPAECTAKKLNSKTSPKIFQDDFYPSSPIDPNLQANISPGQISKLIIPFSEPIKSNELYTIYLNCRNLPMYSHYPYFYFIPLATIYMSDTTYPTHDKEDIEECTLYGNVIKPYCKGKDSNALTDLFNPFLISNQIQVREKCEQFTYLSNQEKLQFIIDQSKLIDNEDFSEKDIELLIILNGYLSKVDCSKFPSYTKCRDDKIAINTKIYERIHKKYNNVYYETLPWPEENIKASFLIKYTKLLYQHSVNTDSFSVNQGKLFIDDMFRYLDDLDKILLLYKESNRPSITTIFTAILNNLIDLLRYEEIDNGFSNDNPKPDPNTRLYPHVYPKKLKSHLEKILLRHKKFNNVENRYGNFDYNFHTLSSSSAMTNEVIQLEDYTTTIKVPLKYLEEKRVKYLMGIVYYDYPMLSFNNSLTYYSGVTIMGYDDKDEYVEIKDMPETETWSIGIFYNEGEDKNKWQYCGYYDEANGVISSKGMKTKAINELEYNCVSNRFGDFLMTSHDIYNEPNPKTDPDTPDNEWVILLIICIAAGLILIILIITVIICIKHARESDDNIEGDIALSINPMNIPLSEQVIN